MCGRFTLSTPADVVAEVLELASLPVLEPRYNIAPTQLALAVRGARADAGGAAGGVPGRRGDMLRWGLIPRWAKDVSIGARMINARGETLTSKPSFRSAFRRRRCLIPADGFYEWQQRGKGKQPYYIKRHDGMVFALAGLWELWQSPDGAPVESCTIITTEPNDAVKPLHDRMPVILAPGDFDLWLDPEVTQPERVQPLLRPSPPEELVAYPVSTHVNSPAHDSPECVAPH